MTGLAWLCLVFALGYPFWKFFVNRWNDRAEEALRRKGFKVPRKRHHTPRMPQDRKLPPLVGSYLERKVARKL